MSWDDLRVFLALHREGTVAGAARALGVSRSTVLRRWAALEAATTTLFERTPEGVVLTGAGERLLPSAERVEGEALAAERAIAGADEGLRGSLEVTLFDIAGPLLAPAFQELMEAHPEMDLRLVSSDRLRSLRRREADLAIRGTDAPSPELFGRKIGRIPFGVFGTPGRVAEANPPWVLWPEERGAEGSWAVAREGGRPLRVAALVDSSFLLLEMVCAGAGVALLPVPLAVRRPELVPRGPALDEMGLDVWALVHPDLRGAARARAVMAHLGARGPALLAGRVE